MSGRDNEGEEVTPDTPSHGHFFFHLFACKTKKKEGGGGQKKQRTNNGLSLRTVETRHPKA